MILGTAAEANEILEKLGSTFRAEHSTPVGPAFIAILDAIPGYVEKLVGERMKEIKSTTGSAKAQD